MNEENKTSITKQRVVWIIVIVLLVLVVGWFSLIMYNYYRVNTEKKPILCFNNVKEIETNNEYSYTCYGIFYKYKEYHSNNNDKLIAREFTLFFKDFDRK